VDGTQRDVKRALRPELIARRARLGPEERAERSRAITDRIEELAAFRAAHVVALYAPMGAEVDTAELARRARGRGVLLAYPRVVPHGDRRLAFAICPPERLVAGPVGALEPPAGAPLVAPPELGCVVMPGVAFSEDGLRLGRGGGYYDATLAALPGVARIGLAFDLQIVPALPAEAHDARLDALVTEARVLVFRRESR
jgi:5-formyltetrahydrofolate cyclo-ligase